MLGAYMRTTEQTCRADISILFCWGKLWSAGNGCGRRVIVAPSHGYSASSPATPRPSVASNGSERENVYGNQEIQQFEPYEKIRRKKVLGEEKLQQEKVEHQKIWPKGKQERRAGNEGVQTGKAQEWIGPEGHQPQTSDCDWVVGSEKIWRQGAEEKIFQLKTAWKLSHAGSRFANDPRRA